MSLTPKQRLLRAIKGEEIDYVPFSPFLAYYFDNLPSDVIQKGQLNFLEEMGADPLLRGFGCAFGSANEKCSITEKIKGNKKYVTRTTPKGNLYSEYTFVEQANTWFLTKHPVSTLEDLYTMKAFFEDIQIINQVDILNSFLDDIGERGLVLSLLGYEGKSSFQSLIEHWIGTENLIYMCADYPGEIEEVLNTMKKVSQKTVEYNALSKVSASISWEDSSTTNVSPELYRKYISPEISTWCNILNERGICYVQHACGHIKDLLNPIAEQGVSAIESLTPLPTGNITLKESFEILPKTVSIIGGIDPLMMLNGSFDEIECYTKDILKVLGNRGFILSNSDSCPPNVDYQKFLHLSKLVKNFGK